MLATTVVCGIMLKKSYLGDMYLLPQFLINGRILGGFQLKNHIFLHQNRLLLYVWWNVIPLLIINKTRELNCEFILANPPNS